MSRMIRFAWQCRAVNKKTEEVMKKFIKETTRKKLVIPNAALKLSGLEKG